MIGQAAMVLFLTYFLLLSGDTYKRKLVRLTRPSLSNKKITVHIVDDINASIQRYMLMLLIATIVGTFITTWLTGRIARMNTAAVFVSLLFWTWLWGVWAMLLSMPIMMLIKVVAQHVEQLELVAELLGIKRCWLRCEWLKFNFLEKVGLN